MAIAGASLGLVELTPIRLDIGGNYLSTEDDEDFQPLLGNHPWFFGVVLLLVSIILIIFISSGSTEALSSGFETFVAERPRLLLLSFIIPTLITFVASSSAITSISSYFLINLRYGIASILSLLILLIVVGIYIGIAALSAISLIRPVAIVLTIILLVILFLFGLYVLPTAAVNILILRPEQWLFISLLRVMPSYRSRRFGHVTPIPLIGLSSQISEWLRYDWTIALRNN